MANKKPIIQRDSVFNFSTPPKKPKSGKVQKSESPKVNKSTKGDMGRTRYTTYLRPDLIKSIKRYALDHDQDDYEVVELALEKFLGV